MMHDERAQPIICIEDKSHKEDRLATVIGDMPFYKSTGRNSREKDTWFPFMGLQEQGMGDFLPRGMFLKPSTRNSSISNSYPKELAGYVRENQSFLLDFVTRFGNFECMCLSMLIGEGFWKQEDGKKLEGFIRKIYPGEINHLAKYWQPVIAEIQKFHAKVEVFNVNKPEKVNDWLKNQGAMGEKDQYGSTYIEFGYSDFRLKYTQPISNPSMTKPEVSGSTETNDLIVEISKAKAAIESSFMFYRTEAKNQKLIVLDTAEKYLKGEKTTRDDLLITITNNKDYADAIGTSSTKTLIEKVLAATPTEPENKKEQEYPSSSRKRGTSIS